MDSYSYLSLNSAVNHQAMLELFMCEMSGARELTSYAMLMHEIFKPALDNSTIRQHGSKTQGSKTRTKITTATTAYAAFHIQSFLQEATFTKSKVCFKEIK